MYDRLPITGVTTTHTAPKSYRRLERRHGVDMREPNHLQSVIDHLQVRYDIEWRDLTYCDHTGAELKHHPAHHYRALVNPAWVGAKPEDIPGDRLDAVWHIPTKRYTKAAHHLVWQPLADAIESMGLGRSLFGECRIRREGGEVHMDLFFKEFAVSHDGEMFIFGVSSGHDYYGNTRLYLDFCAYHDTGDGMGQIMRHLSKPKRRKHTGTADEEVQAWFESALTQLSESTTMLHDIVSYAMSYEIPVAEMPCTIEEFYEYLGLPNSGASALAEPAAEHLLALEPAEGWGPLTAWHLYKNGMWAIEHEYESRDTSSFKKHCEAVNLLLFNPRLAHHRVLKKVVADVRTGELEADVDDETRAAVADELETELTRVSEGVEDVSRRRERFRMLLEDSGVEEPSETESSSHDATEDKSEEEADV